METARELITEELRMFIEEQWTGLKNATRRTFPYFMFVLVLALGGGYGTHRYWMAAHFTPFQRLYFGQYWESSYKRYLRHTGSHYTILARTITDPRTGKDITVGLTNSQVEAELDNEGHLRLNESGAPTFTIKDDPFGLESLLWWEPPFTDTQAYEFFRDSIYEKQPISEILRPAWTGAVIIFCFGIIAILVGDQLGRRFFLFLRGEYQRYAGANASKAYVCEDRSRGGDPRLRFAEGDDGAAKVLKGGETGC